MLIYVCTSTTDLMLASETIKVTTLYTYNFGISYIYISMYISEREIKETIKFLYGKHNTSTPCTISKPRVCMHVRQHMNRSMHACRPRASRADDIDQGPRGYELPPAKYCPSMRREAEPELLEAPPPPPYGRSL